MGTRSVCLALVLPLVCSSGSAQLQQSSVPRGPYVSALAISGRNLSAGTGESVFRSGDSSSRGSFTELVLEPEEMPADLDETPAQSGKTGAMAAGTPAPRARRLAFELGYAENEIRIGFPGIEVPEGKCRLIGPAINFTTLIHDPYNADRPATSVSGLGTLGLIIFASFFHSDDVGRNASSALRTLILFPALLANSELHGVLFSPDSISDPGARTLSIYVATRTEVFVPWISGASAWVRFSPAVGLSLLTQDSPRGPSRAAKSIGIQCGVDYPVDIIPNAKQNGLRVFVGVRYLFPM